MGPERRQGHDGRSVKVHDGHRPRGQANRFRAPVGNAVEHLDRCLILRRGEHHLLLHAVVWLHGCSERDGAHIRLGYIRRHVVGKIGERRVLLRRRPQPLPSVQAEIPSPGLAHLVRQLAKHVVAARKRDGHNAGSDLVYNHHLKMSGGYPLDLTPAHVVNPGDVGHGHVLLDFRWSNKRGRRQVRNGMWTPPQNNTSRNSIPARYCSDQKRPPPKGEGLLVFV